MNDLTVSIIQESIIWQQPQANRTKFADLMESRCSGSDLILLPEMFTTGFAQESAKNAETMDGETIQWMLKLAAAKQCHIAGSIVIREGDQVFNRLIWAEDNGQLHIYNKRHLFSFAGEDKIYSPGSERIIVDCKGWRCCPQVCYDLRFPVWSRNRDDYDLLVYVANWPKVRVSHWSQLLVARAIENLAYVVGVNRVGEDGNGFAHNGQSIVLDPKGQALVEPGSKAGVYTVTLNYAELLRYREKFGALNDADKFTLEI